MTSEREREIRELTNGVRPNMYAATITHGQIQELLTVLDAVRKERDLYRGALEFDADHVYDCPPEKARARIVEALTQGTKIANNEGESRG